MKSTMTIMMPKVTFQWVGQSQHGGSRLLPSRPPGTENNNYREEQKFITDEQKILEGQKIIFDEQKIINAVKRKMR